MSVIDRTYEVMVIGGGVAGTHAAVAAAKEGAKTLLVTSSCDTIAYLGWGPRFSSGSSSGTRGPGKSGLKPALIFQGEIRGEEATIVDAYKYQGHWQQKVEKDQNITVFQDTSEELIGENNVWKMRTRWGVEFKSKAVVLCLGTFLGAMVEVGQSKTGGGRPGEAGAEHLGGSLKAIGLKLSKAEMTAGPVVGADRIKWGKLHKVKDEIGPWWAKTGQGHEVIAEPTNSQGTEYYLRGSGKLDRSNHRPEAIKTEGLAAVEIIKPAYKVVYQCVSKNQIDKTGEARKTRGIFLAGRIVGAESYIASATQGAIAGASGAQRVSRET